MTFEKALEEIKKNKRRTKMKYIKINTINGRKFIIDLDKVESFTTSQDVITFNYHNDEAFVFNNGSNDRGIHITDFDKVKEFIEKLGE